MYSDNTGSAWELYKLYYTDALRSIGTFNSVPYASVIAVGDNGYIIYSVDGGGTWTVDTGAVTNANLNALTNTGIDLSGIVVGNQGTILQTANDGVNWTKLVSPVTTNLYSVMIDAFGGNGFAVGADETILTTYDFGNSWNLAFSGTAGFAEFRGIYMINSFTAVIVGDTVSGVKPLIIRTNDGGTSWTPVVIPVLNNVKLYGVSFLDSINGMAVGSAGTILKTTDGGMSWQQRFAFIADELFSVNYNSEVCMAVGYKTILQSFDLGETWTASRIDSANGNLYAIYKLDAGNYFVSGD